MMSINPDCFYCAKDQRLHDLMIEIAPLEASTLYLFKEQTHPGRCVLAFNRHVKELYRLEPEEIAAFFHDVSRVAAAINAAMAPTNINYGIYNDTGLHLHCHVVPKYEGGYSWGSTFEMMPAQRTLLTDDAYSDLIQKIKAHL